MSKLEKYSLLLFGYLIFAIAYTRIGFFLNIPITNLHLIIATVLYFIYVLLVFQRKAIEVLFYFLLTLTFLGLLSSLLAHTYDTSWDGQGYHQSAVIALKGGWNPVTEPRITFTQELPSEIFAESYPSALWEFQAMIYSLTGKVNTAKIVNVAVAVVAFCAVYNLFLRLKLDRGLSGVLALILVAQPLYLLQLLTFMQDGFGYQLLLIAVSALVFYIIKQYSPWGLTMFVFAELMLVSTKYSHLPLALLLGIIFLLVTLNRYLNKEYTFNTTTQFVISGVIFLSLIFASIPYARNYFVYGTPFYPTNITDLSGAVTYNNLPNNLQEKDKFTQFLYGIFGRSQSIESGDTRSDNNIAYLKVPFTFSVDEIKDAASLYNNRVGAAGPIFSGIVLVSLIFIAYLSFKAEKIEERYAVYSAFFGLGLIVISSLFVPTPNLLRYVSQVQMMPFMLVVPVLSTFKRRLVYLGSAAIIILVFINNAFYASAVIAENISDTRSINATFEELRNSGKVYRVKALHFYSSYILLDEQNVPFVTVDRLNCDEPQYLVATSTSTLYCVN